MEANSFVLCRSQSNHDSLTNPAGTSGRILGSACGSTAVEILVTVQGDGVVAYNSSKQLRTRSWPLGSRGATFATPAVWDTHTSRYYTALETLSEGQHLVSWEKSTDSNQSTSGLIDAPVKRALGGVAVHSLWPVSQPKRNTKLASGAVVVFHDGSVAAFGADLAQTSWLPGVERGTVEAVAVSRKGGALFVAIAGYKRGAARRAVKVVELSSSVPAGSGEEVDVLKVRQELELPHSGEGSVASVSLGENLDLSVLWDDGRWQSFCADRNGAGQGWSYKPGHIRKLAVFQGETRAKSKKTPKKKRANLDADSSLVEASSSGRLLAMPGSSYVAAVGPAEGGRGGLVVVILDTQYGCLHKRFALAARAEEDAKTDSLSTLLDARSSSLGALVGLQNGGDEGSLLVSTSEKVIVCDVSLTPLSLAGMLGALARVPSGGPTGVPPGRSVEAPAGAEVESSSGWGALANDAAVMASSVYGQSEVESLQAPASRTVVTPSISGRGVVEEESSLVRREEGGVWDVERGVAAEDELLKRIRDATSEQELASLLGERFGSGREGGDAQPRGANGLPNGVHANGRNDSDDSDLEDGQPNGSTHQNGFAQKNGVKKNGKGSKGPGKEANGTPKRLSHHLRQCSSEVVTAVVERSLETRSWSVLESVLWSGSLPAGSASPYLMRTLAGAQQLRLLETVTAYLRDLPPADLAFLLRFQISDADQETLQQLAAERKKSALAKVTKLAAAVKEGQVSKARRREVTAVRLVADAVDLFTPREAALHALVAVPRDETVLAAALRELNAAEVSFLVGYFTKWMDVYFDRAEVSAPKWGRIVLPSLAQVVRWLSLLLDVHLTRLVLLPDCHQVVGRLHRVVAAQVTLTRKLVPLGGVTAHIRNKAKLPSRRAASGKPAGGYSVEVLSLD